ncbi:MAG TPA: hypothetical protein VMB81_14885 [Candidatus Sulfotelmatobacter sp.]|nr:hypothetical protein [Candidatus Sulfotelmatobacter sp.]
MAYTALFQGQPVRFAPPAKGSVACAPVLDDVLRVLESAGVEPTVLAAAPAKIAASGAIEFGALIHWLEDLRSTGGSEISMFLHWLLRHMPNAQVALGLPLLGYLLLPAIAPRATARQVKRRAA